MLDLCSIAGPERRKSKVPCYQQDKKLLHLQDLLLAEQGSSEGCRTKVSVANKDINLSY